MTDVQPDTKPAARVVDPELLEQLLVEWNEYGCALCGRHGDPEAEAAYRVQLHHIDNKPRDDTRQNIIGLCGAYVTGCHQDFEEGRIKIAEQDGRLIWWGTAPGQGFRRPVRDAPRYEDAELVEDATGRSSPSSAEVDAEVVEQRQLPARRAGSSSLAESQERFKMLRTAVHQTERSRLAIATMLGLAYDEREYEALEMTWPAYYTEAGLDKGTASKMLAVWQTFRGDWAKLPDRDQSQLSVERLYIAKRLVDQGKMGPSEALHEAVANPTHQLVAQTKGDEPAARCTFHACPECGKELWHDRAQ